jgi:hypothetical protein
MSHRAFIGKILTGVAALGLCAATYLPAQAGEVHNREVRQQARIAQGVRNGSLTFGEYNRLENRMARVNGQRMADLRADGGRLTQAQREQLNRELNRDSHHIYYDKHNQNVAQPF